MNSYLIPANTKRSMLIFGMFTVRDLILFASGVVVTTILLLIFNLNNMTLAVISLLPALVTGFMVWPIPNYHNVLTLLISCVEFFTNQRKFKWKGWCVPHEEEKK
jgi:hypothetical protein